MNNVKSNCYGCADRYVGCHANCESYKQYKAKVDALNIYKMKQTKLYYDIKASKSKIVKR